MDIGTNSVRLLVVRFAANHAYRVVTDQKEVVRLGESEFADRRLHPAAMNRAVLVCRKLAELARSYNSAEIVAVATSATREAQNQAEFLRRLQEEAGLEVRVVSGLEEARLIYQGVASGMHLNGRQALFIDIGGGSTEVSVGDQRQYHYLGSLKLGAIRLNTMFLQDEIGPISPARYAQLQQHVRHTAVYVVQEVRRHRVDLGVGSSGTIQNLADIGVRLALKRRRERDDVLTQKQLRQAVELLCSLPLEARRNVPGINPERADIIIGGAAILETLMQDLGLPELVISDRGLRDGLLVDYIARSEHGPALHGLSVRCRSVLQLARACGFDEAHAHTVARLALELFDSARVAGLHELGEWERELLEYAALLHDIGAFLSYSNHHAHTYYLIRNADLLGFDQAEIALLAATAYYHRKGLPGRKDPQFVALDKRGQQALSEMSLLLRIAENLDRSHAGLVEQVRLYTEGKKTVVLEARAAGDVQLERWGIESRKELLERAFGRKLLVRF